MWNEFEGTVFCNRNTDPLDANVSGVVEAFDCIQNIPANLNWYVHIYVCCMYAYVCCVYTYVRMCYVCVCVVCIINNKIISC